MRGWDTRRARQAGAPIAARNSSSTSAAVQSVYEAASQTRRTLGWRAPTASPNHALLGNLTTLRDRSRAATRNDGYAKGAIDKLVTNIVGTGIKPLSKAADPRIREQLQAKWLQWTDESDADGLLDYYGQQAQAVRGWMEGGEMFARLRPRFLTDGLSVPLQLQLLEPELCPHTHNMIPAAGVRVRAGIEFNRIGRRTGFYFHPSRPGDLLDYDPGVLRRIPAENVIHLFAPERAGQLRGIPKLTQGLIRLHELNKFDDATLLRQQLANLFVAFLKKEPDEPGETALHPLTGLARDASEDPAPLTMEPGIFQELEPGQEVQFSEPPEVRQGYRDFIRQQLQGACASIGIPYELLTGDMSGLNDRVVRVLLNEFAATIEALQHQIVAFQFCRRVWRAWMDQVFLSGAVALPADYLVDPEPYVAVSFAPPERRYIHPVQDIEADVAAVAAGFTSRRAVVAKRGEDIENVDAQNAADNARADSLGLQYTSDPREPESEQKAPDAKAGLSKPPAAAVTRVHVSPGRMALVRDRDQRIVGLAPVDEEGSN